MLAAATTMAGSGSRRAGAAE
jgi:hypothetical protein